MLCEYLVHRPRCKPVQYEHVWIWIYLWISTENLCICIWIWMNNFISTASLRFTAVNINELLRHAQNVIGHVVEDR